MVRTTAVITSTGWNNFFKLRCHKDAQPEMRIIADMIRNAYIDSIPVEKKIGEWHLPYVVEEVNDPELVSIGRCARVSYLKHGTDNDPIKDKELALKLIANNHLSPTEHVATPDNYATKSGNFVGWIQYRKSIRGEDGN